ncbi:MAG: hypothetical protein AAF725_25800, partial [Acidobacteriota bacterium]
MPQWVVWRSKTRQGKKTKLPYCSRTGRPAKANDPATWSSFDEACRALAGNDGVGFVFSEKDPYLGIDLDNVIDENGALCAWASRLLKRFGSSAYVEVSPSGRGLHLIVKAQKPGDRCRRKLGQGVIEIYDRRRYFTVTGRVWSTPPRRISEASESLQQLYELLFEEPEARSQRIPRSPAGPTDDDELLGRAFVSKKGAKIRALWNGDLTGYASPSEADLALCSHLLFWTQGDHERADRLFRQSGLMREKWNRASYRQATLLRAGSSSMRSSGLPPTARDKPGEPEPLEHGGFTEAIHPDTDLANAQRLAKHFGHRLRWVAGLGFPGFDGSRWIPSESEAFRCASRIGRLVSHEAAEVAAKAGAAQTKDERDLLNRQAESLHKWARSSEQAKTLKSCLEISQSLLELDAKELDTHPLLLNVENGTLDLESGQLRPHKPEDFVTHKAPVRFEPDARAPRWEAFIAEIM